MGIGSGTARHTAAKSSSRATKVDVGHVQEHLRPRASQQDLKVAQRDARESLCILGGHLYKKKIKGTICPTGLDKRRAPKCTTKAMHVIILIVQFNPIHNPKSIIKNEEGGWESRRNLGVGKNRSQWAYSPYIINPINISRRFQCSEA